MKKLFCLFIVLALLISFSGCGNDNVTNGSNNSSVNENNIITNDESVETSKPTESDKPSTNIQQPSHTHNFSQATCTQPATCSCGKTNGSALGHNWKNATCTTPKKCNRCGITDGEVTPHDFSNGKCLGCGKQAPFEPIKYTGVGKKIIRNVNFPEGTYLVSCTYKGNSNFVVRFYEDLAKIWYHGIANEIGTCTTEAIVKGKAVNGYFEIKYVDSSDTWTITIEQIG